MENQSDYIKQLETRVQHLSALLEVNNIMNTALLSENSRLQSLLNYLMNAAADIAEADAASVLLWNNTTHELYFAATTTNNSSDDLIGKVVPLDSIAGQIFQEKRVIQVDDIRHEPRHYTKVDEDIEFVTRSIIGVPMIAKNKVIGVLEVVNKRQLPWTDDDRTNLVMLANEAAVVIDVAKLVNDIQRANEELSELDKLKSDFIAIASHELRTPLGIIMGYASFLQDSADEATRVHAEKVMGSALQLRRIIEDMINLRYIKQKASDLNREHLTVRMLMDDLRRDSTTLTDMQNHKIHFEHTDGDKVLFVDRTRIAMAFANVLNNAAAFTPEPSTIKVRAFAKENREIWFQITDTGQGIAADQLERIFEEFYQVEDHMTRHHGGLGIGLSICRAVVNAHDGRVWAESLGPGQGSTFTIALPLTQDAGV